jgi:hypothetical protein
VRVLAIAFAAWLALASSAAAKQETSTSGQVTATFSYAGGPGRGFSDL